MPLVISFTAIAVSRPNNCAIMLRWVGDMCWITA
jgi:hypothetical protein